MHIHIIYAHPGKKSFTHRVFQEFTKGLDDAGHKYSVSDLYELNFLTDMDIEQYRREMGNDPEAPVPADVKKEQEKVNAADALVFIYPVWWSDCPARLKGWFDRVWTHGYAYFYDDSPERKSLIKPDKALVLCTAGHTVEHLEETGIDGAMRCIMLDDRLGNVGIKHAEMVILGGTTAGGDRQKEIHLARAYELGKGHFRG